MKLYTSLLAMLVLMLSCSPRAHATDIVWTPYMSLDEAAHDALIDAYNCSESRRECGGVIWRYQSAKIPYVLYFYSAPVTSNHAFNVNIPALAEPAPTHMALVGDYHTHPCLGRKELGQFFSPADVITNQGFHTVGYMLDNCSFLVHRFDPAQDDVDDEEIDMDSGRKMFLTIGHIVGWIDPHALQRPGKAPQVRPRLLPQQAQDRSGLRRENTRVQPR